MSRHLIPMVLSLKDPEADRLAREVAARTGETLTTAVVVALWERLARLRGRSRRRRLRDDLFACALARVSGEPLLFKGDDFARTDIARVT
jgi:antitoxin VapB